MSDTILPFTPLIIIGAGRSGTNILRDTLTALDGFETWPCDEINPIWRHGNLFWPDDEIPAERATPAIRRFIRDQFIKFWKSAGQPPFVVEKTCANALRVPFLDAVLPEARYINIVRDGYDVVASAKKRWQGEFELDGRSYLLAKARYTPLRDLPIYAYRTLSTRVKVALGRAEHLGIWGPRVKGIDDMKDASLIDLCALQWIACVERADAAYDAMIDGRVAHVTYEGFMSDPKTTIGDILAHIAPSEISDSALSDAVAGVRPPSASKRHLVAPELSVDIRAQMDTLMRAKGYEV